MCIMEQWLVESMVVETVGTIPFEKVLTIETNRDGLLILFDCKEYDQTYQCLGGTVVPPTPSQARSGHSYFVRISATSTVPAFSIRINFALLQHHNTMTK